MPAAVCSKRRSVPEGQTLDHSAIFLLIAGTYTPITLVHLRGGWGWTLFGIIWGLAAGGIVVKVFFTGRLRVLSILLYVAPAT